MASADGSAPTNDTTDQMAPIQCTSGCGFFGNPSTGNMCSKCFKESCSKVKTTEAASPKPVAEAPKPVPPPAVSEPTVVTSPVAAASAAPPDVSEPCAVVASAPAATEAVAAAAASVSSVATPAEVTPPAASAAVCTAEEDEEPPRKVQANTSRCWTCNRKIGLLGFQCKCEYYFCSEHRYSDKHECAFDYKAQGKQQLTKANPTIAPAKMESM